MAAQDEAAMDELYLQLQPGAYREYVRRFIKHTKPSWQTQMRMLVYGTGVDTNLPAYERGYVTEAYNRILPLANAEFNLYILSRTPPQYQAGMTTRLTTGSTQMTAYIAALGAAPSAGRQRVLNTFVAAEVLCGAFPLLDDYWILNGETTNQALMSFKRLVACTPIGAPVFTAMLGYTFNGTADALNTNCNPSTNCPNVTVNKARLGVYATGLVQAGGIMIGVNVGGTSVFRINPYSGSSVMFGSAMFASTTWNLPSNFGDGYTVVSKYASGDARAFRNGGALVPVGGPPADGTIPGVVIYIGATNANGTLNAPRAGTGQYADIGGPLPPAMEAQHNANVQLLMSSVP